MKRKINYLLSIIVCTIIIALNNKLYAASANISATKSLAYVGDSVSISVTVSAAAWNLNVSGNGINGGSITGFNIEGVNQTTTRTYTLNTSSVGTYVISLKGDISDGATDATTDISKTVTVSIKEKPVVVTPNTSTHVNSGTNVTKPSTTKPMPSTNTSINNNTVKLNSNAYLSEFRVDEPGITPSFNKEVFNYAITVGEDVNNLNVTTIPEDSNAIVNITGNTELKYGDNKVVVTVTAQDKKTVNTYTITVTKAEDEEKSNALLQNLIVEDVTLTPEFSPEIFDYDLGNISIEKLNISAFPINEKAKVDIVGNDNLIIGKNNIKVIVTSENGKYQKTYNLNVIRQNIEENSLKKLKVNNNNQIFPGIWSALKEHVAVVLLYALVWIEFLQVVYLYERLKKAENVDIITKDNVHEEAYVDKIKKIIKRIKVWNKQ